MEKIITIFLFLLSTAKSAVGQSLIVNGDFEMLYDCPKYVGDIDLVREWHNGNFTPDIFSSCTNGQENGLNVPHNYAGTKYAASGNCYTGIVLFTKQSNLSKNKATKLASQYGQSLLLRSIRVKLTD